MDMQDGACRDRRVHFHGLTAEGRRHKHAEAHRSGIVHFDADFASSEIWVEDRADIADPSIEDLPGICVQTDLSRVTQMHGGQIVFVNIADDPHAGKIGDGERRRAKALYASGVGDLLIGDYSRNRSHHFHLAFRVARIVAEQLQMFLRGLDVDLGFIFGVFGGLQIGLRDRAVAEQILGAFQLRAR